jgi:hypothetical protein
MACPCLFSTFYRFIDCRDFEYHQRKKGCPRKVWGGRKAPRDFALIALTNDWADHYSAATYLRLNGLLPPTAKKAAATAAHKDHAATSAIGWPRAARQGRSCNHRTRGI